MSKRNLNVFEKHQLNVARKTMMLSCEGCRIMGGPNHCEAIEIAWKLKGQNWNIDDCTCELIGGNNGTIK